MDYRVVLESTWVGIDNFANVLYNPDFWERLVEGILFRRTDDRVSASGLRSSWRSCCRRFPRISPNIFSGRFFTCHLC